MTLFDVISKYLLDHKGIAIEEFNNNKWSDVVGAIRKENKYLFYVDKNKILIPQYHDILLTISAHNNKLFDIIDRVVSRPSVEQIFENIMTDMHRNVRIKIDRYHHSIYISNIIANVAGCGYGRKVLSRLCEISDKHLIPIFANVVPLKVNGYDMSTEKLNSIYEELGFRKSNPEMCFGFNNGLTEFMTNFKVRRPKYD